MWSLEGDWMTTMGNAPGLLGPLELRQKPTRPPSIIPPSDIPNFLPSSVTPLELQSHWMPNFLMRTIKSWPTGESSRGLLSVRDQKLLWNN